MSDVDESSWTKSGVTVIEKNNLDITALDDGLKFNHAIFYTGTESVSGVTATYADDVTSKFIVPTLTKNYEDNGIFHGDVKVALMSLPTYVVGNSLQLNYSRYYNDYRYLTSIYFPEDHLVKEKVRIFHFNLGFKNYY